LINIALKYCASVKYLCAKKHVFKKAVIFVAVFPGILFW